MSLLGFPSRPFPAIFSSPTCSLTRPSASSTPLTGTRRSPCASPPWCGMSGYLANQTPETITLSEYKPSRFTSSSWTKKLFNWFHIEHEKLCMISAKWSTCFASSTWRISRCLSSMRSGCEAKHCHCSWQEIMRRTIILCRCKFDSSNKKQMRSFSENRGTCDVDFSGSKSSSWRSARNFGHGSNIRRMEARWAIIRVPYRTESSSIAHGRRFATTKIRNIDVWRISNSSFSCWTRNCSTSTKRRRTTTRSTTSQ